MHSSGACAGNAAHALVGRTVLRTYGEDRAERLSATGLLHERDLTRPLRRLSTGQRRRLELALRLADPIDLLLLDEPTNHLAPALVEELEAALADYRGTLVTVTHDRRMRQGFTGRELTLTRHDPRPAPQPAPRPGNLPRTRTRTRTPS
ncbi:ATP-binding cassette domain-containing protein [Streptomyces sp. NPDC019539]|uniref:ATP-binding cassette domain-containing protein n=1 Tax=Streptomyces sp. NPDC019539 TaxID=3365063 RepID=UPI00378AE750